MDEWMMRGEVRWEGALLQLGMKDGLGWFGCERF